MKYDKPILIQKINDEEEWEDLFTLHANINKPQRDNKYQNAGAIQDHRSLRFSVRYFRDLEDISYNPQLYRILYNNIPFSIEDYDDYMLQHKSVTMIGVSY